MPSSHTGGGDSASASRLMRLVADDAGVGLEGRLGEAALPCMLSDGLCLITRCILACASNGLASIADEVPCVSNGGLAFIVVAPTGALDDCRLMCEAADVPADMSSNESGVCADGDIDSDGDSGTARIVSIDDASVAPSLGVSVAAFSTVSGVDVAASTVVAAVFDATAGSNSEFLQAHVGQHQSLLSSANRRRSSGAVSRPPIAPFASVWKNDMSATSAVRMPHAGCHDSSW